MTDGCMMCKTKRPPKQYGSEYVCVNCKFRWRKCDRCGCQVSPDSRLCGECACEDDGL